MKTKKPIALFLTDTHLKENNAELVLDIFRQAKNYCIENGIKEIIHGGDLFTSRISQSLYVLISFCVILEEFEGTDITIRAIPGNHDKTDQDSETSYLDVFRYDNFKIYSKEECIKLKGITIGFLPFFTESYSERAKRLESLAKELKTDKNVMITHIAFNGAVNNDGSVVEDSIKPKMVKFWDKVLVGHYHDSNIFDNIHYTGSAYQGNFGERMDDKGFTIIYSDCSLEFIPTDYPKYVKVKLDINDDIDSEIEMVDSKSDNVRFVFSGDKTDIHKIDRQKLSDLGIDVQLELNSVNEEILKAEDGDFSSMSKKNIINYFKEYCEIQDIPKYKMSRGLKILIKD